jgi:radical SAM protein with 4Fe4S-binding SPASM domain
MIFIDRAYQFLRDSAFLNHMTNKGFYYFERFRIYDQIYRKVIKHKIERSPDHPIELAFTLTSLCNSDCIMCPVRRFREIEKSDVKFMSMELYERIIADAGSLKINRIILSGGEPLLDPHLTERIEIARKYLPDAELSLFTNGTLLHKRNNISNLLKGSLDSITVSFDGVTAAEYEAVRKQLSFNQLIRNVKLLYQTKKELNSKVLIRLSLLTLKANERSHGAFLKRMKGSADVLDINKAHNFGGTISFEEKNIYNSFKRYPCCFLFHRITVKPDGLVSMCSYDYEKKYIVGDLNLQSIKTIWNHDLYRQARQLHLEENFESIDICKNCTSEILWWKYNKMNKTT